jgi:hypothetical protein
MDFREVVWGMDWIDLAQNRNKFWALVNAVMNFRGFITYWGFLE